MYITYLCFFGTFSLYDKECILRSKNVKLRRKKEKLTQQGKCLIIFLDILLNHTIKIKNKDKSCLDECKSRFHNLVIHGKI